MPYLFGVLVLANALMLGYYIFVPQHPNSASMDSAQAALTKPIEVSYTSEHVPPLIGTKK